MAEDLLARAARVIQHEGPDGVADDAPETYLDAARALAAAGLLHDHEQCLEINRGWVAYRERTKVRRREFLDRIALLTRERDALENKLAEVTEWCKEARAQATQGVHMIDRIRAVLRDPMLDEAMMLDQINAILDEAPSPAGRGAKVNRNDEAGLPYYGSGS